jgi:hypothetical protein
VDLEAQPQAEDAARPVQEVLGQDGEPEVAWRGPVRRMARLVRADALPQAVPALRRDACYLVTGGCGFLGLAVAAWLAGQGATQLVLASRHGPSPEAQARIDALRAQGADVRSVRADVAEPADVARLLGLVAGPGMHPLRGVVHAAGVGEPCALADLDAPALRAVLRPKLAGACCWGRRPKRCRWTSSLSCPPLRRYGEARAWRTMPPPTMPWMPGPTTAAPAGLRHSASTAARAPAAAW